jgi:competence protein ComEA
VTIVTLDKFFKKTDVFDRGLIVFLVVGFVLVFVGLFRGVLNDRQVQVEYLNVGVGGESGKTGEISEIYIDIEGAVISPGVYSLPINSRLKDLLVVAGGYSVNADREYCEKNLNLAQVLKDGQKVYIPNDVDTPGSVGYVEAKTTSNQLNINTATDSELDTLWGVGPARAETIVKNRPYGSMEELVSRGGMTKQIYEKNIDRIVLF